MSLPLFALATGSEIILTNESHTVNVQVGLETVVKVLENSKAPHSLHSPFSDPSYQRSGDPPPRVPWQHSSLSSDHVWTNELVEAFSWGYLSTSFNSTGTKWYRGVCHFGEQRTCLRATALARPSRWPLRNMLAEGDLVLMVMFS